MLQKLSPHGELLWSRQPPTIRTFIQHSLCSTRRGDIQLGPKIHFNTSSFIHHCLPFLFPPVLNLSPKEEAKVDHGKQPLDAPQFTEINPCGNCSCIQKNPIFPCMKLEYVVYGEEGRKTYNMGFF
jgi:hypothetical protein